MVEELSHGDLVVVGVRVLELDDPRLLHGSEYELECFSVGNGNKNGSGLLGLEYALPFLHVLVVCIGGHFGFIITNVDVFKAVKGMAKERGVFGLRIDEPGEAVLLPMVVKFLEDFNNGASDAFDVGVGRCLYHLFKDVGGGGKGSGDVVQGRHDGTGARERTVEARAAAADTSENREDLWWRRIK